MAKSTQKRKRGRPRIVESPEEFDRLVDEYVAECRETKVPVTSTGLALHLGFCDRRSLWDYKQYDGFSRSVKRALTLVEHELEKRMHSPSAGGAIFGLKNFGWTDRQDEAGSDVSPNEYAEATVEALQQMEATLALPPGGNGKAKKNGKSKNGKKR